MLSITLIPKFTSVTEAVLQGRTTMLQQTSEYFKGIVECPCKWGEARLRWLERPPPDLAIQLKAPRGLADWEPSLDSFVSSTPTARLPAVLVTVHELNGKVRRTPLLMSWLALDLTYRCFVIFISLCFISFLSENIQNNSVVGVPAVCLSSC